MPDLPADHTMVSKESTNSLLELIIKLLTILPERNPASPIWMF